MYVSKSERKMKQEEAVEFDYSPWARESCVLPGKGRGCKGLAEALGGGQARTGATSLCQAAIQGCLGEIGACLHVANVLGVGINDNTVCSVL